MLLGNVASEKNIITRAIWGLAEWGRDGFELPHTKCKMLINNAQTQQIRDVQARYSLSWFCRAVQLVREELSSISSASMHAFT